MPHWNPTTTPENLQLRAEIFTKLRQFFHERGVLEVETPLLCHSTIPDPHIHSLLCESFYLQTSPEFAMKRLLAAASGDIYQICKAFRKGEQGKRHNPEFTMLEWYRIGFGQHELMNEVDALLRAILHTNTSKTFSYEEIFTNYLQINPHTCSVDELKQCAEQHQLTVTDLTDKDDWLNLLLSHIIEPKLGYDQPVFIYDYPSTQAALAKIRHENYPVAERFECYYQGIELANGFHELTDAEEQRQRFEENNKTRNKLNLVEIPIDEYFLQALESGLPDCAGVAIGVDRLVMLAANSDSITDVIAFPMDRV